MLDAVVIPDGLVELAGRTSAAASAVAATADALAAAQDRETLAQDALLAAPARGPVEESLTTGRRAGRGRAERGATGARARGFRGGAAVRR